jgi:hypothetical protein
MKDTEIYDLQSSKEVQINFEKKTITYSKRGEIKYYESNNKILNRVLDKEIKYLSDLVSDMGSRINQTEIIQIGIPNGYKERIPLSESKKKTFIERVKIINKDIEFLTTIKKK